MNVIAAFSIVSWVFGNLIFSLFSKKQGHTHYDIYRRKMYGIAPDRSNDEEETVNLNEDEKVFENEEP